MPNEPWEDGVLDEICRSVERLIPAGATPPRRVSVRAGEIAVELEWPQTGAPAAAEAVGASAVAEQGRLPEQETHVVRSSLVGTFYRCPEPGAKPFVEEGDIVEPGQQVGIIEAMKLMTPVETDRSGCVAEILVGDGEPVEYDARLIALSPLDEE